MSAVKNSARAKIVITPTSGTAITFCELEVTPPSIQAGDSIDGTNSCTENGYRYTIGSSFVTVGEASAKVLFDPEDYGTIGAALGEKGKGTVVITYEDGQKVTFDGFLKSFTPDSMATNEDNLATASITIEASGGAIPVAS